MTQAGISLATEMGTGLGVTKSLLAGLGSRLLHHWEPSAATVMLNSGNVSSLADRVSGGLAQTQGSAGNQPQYNEDGGPNDAPYITSQGVVRHLSAAVGIGEGNRVSWYMVAQSPGTAGQRLTRSVSGSGTHQILERAAGSPDGYRAYARRDDTTLENTGVVSAPPHDTDWHLFSFVPLATGWKLRVDGVDTVTNFGTGNTVDDIATFPFFSDQGNAGGNLAMLMLVDSVTAADNSTVEAYSSATFGLP